MDEGRIRNNRVRIPLLQWGNFTAHSGRRLLYKVECDALSATDWDCVAHLVWKMWPEFGRVVGIPRGGLPLANRLALETTKGSNKVLIVDDVLTSGGSMTEMYRKVKLEGEGLVERPGGEVEIIGAVLFARGPIPKWVKAVFYTATEIW